MDEFWSWFGSDGLELLGNILIPVAAILIPTGIAIRSARSERKSATEDREQERQLAAQDREQERQHALEARRTELRLQAGAGVITALAPLTSIRPDQPIQEHLWRLRAAIAVYRAWIDVGNRSGDWLALRHHEGMALWRIALDKVDAYGGPQAVLIDGKSAILDGAYQWANDTTETFTGFLSAHVPIKHLLDDGARILREYPYLAGAETGAGPEPR
ncbi:hypothetical protein [Microbacterium sp. CGR1]|uniref:hypothetical protein n=1 Tax=Microbacterium sp. CGR1 TaxID=1696072 RepID=UPI003DA3BD70